MPLYAECLNSIYEMTFENLPWHMMSGESMVDGKTADDTLAQVIVYMINKSFGCFPYLS